MLTIEELTPQQLQEAQERMLRQAESKLLELETQITKLREQADIQRRLVAAYRLIVAHARGGPLPTEVLSVSMFDTVHVSDRLRSIRGGGRKPGNRQTTMPPRAERFAKIGVAEAIVVLAQEFGTAKHANEYASQIWHIQNQRDLTKAKRTLNSTLARLAGKGKIKKFGEATFGPVPQGG